ncbi:MAG: Gfo/Idh/MocA family oxidoreductase [Chloroflexi bacterium]|nr:Gfo/Idh/MocA family oxidoreductase [Chloroflexota bacterium]
MNHLIRWGILGTGQIARQFAAGLKSLPEAQLAAIGSRARESAVWFADQFSVPRRHATYVGLVNDPEIDVVYVATPHSCHKANTLLALAAGKAVLCEKPFAINAAEAEEAIRFARHKQLFLMEAMWTRFFPLMEKLRELLRSGAIGEPRLLTADFGFRTDFQEEERLFAPAYGGGALLDVGVYPVSLASMIFGAPQRIASLASMGGTGVDEESAVILSHAGGPLAVLTSAICTETPQEAVIMGTNGRVRIHRPWWRPSTLTLTRDGREEETLEFPLVGNGYQHEAAAVMQCLREGKLESSIMPLAETLSIMKTLDAIRAQWGLKYPME